MSAHREWKHQCPRCGRVQILYVRGEVRCGNVREHSKQTPRPVMRVVAAPELVSA